MGWTGDGRRLRVAQYRRGKAWFRLTSLWLFFVLSAPFLLIVAIAPFKIGALAHAVTKPTTSSVDILTGLLICMWNYMGWDNASTIATEVEKSAADVSARHAGCGRDRGPELHCFPVAAMWMTGLSSSAWETGFWADIAGLLGGPLLRIGLALGGMISALRHVQRPGDELLAPAPGHGAGRHAASRLRQAASSKSRAPWVAIIASAPSAGRLCLGLGFARLVTLDILALRRQPFAGVRRAHRPAGSRARTAAPVPRSWRNVRSRSPIGIAPMLLLGIFRHPQRALSKYWNMSSFAFGMILIAAGVVAYLLNHTLKPEGWAPASQEKPEVVA
jgi:hypothetical protein